MSDKMNICDKLRKILEDLVLVTFEDFQRVCSKMVYKTIFDAEKVGEREYVGGELIFECVDDKNFTCSYSLYFQDKAENFFKEAAKTGNLPLSSLASDFREELLADKILKFKIPEPDEEAREIYGREQSELK